MSTLSIGRLIINSIPKVSAVCGYTMYAVQSLKKSTKYRCYIHVYMYLYQGVCTHNSTISHHNVSCMRWLSSFDLAYQWLQRMLEILPLSSLPCPALQAGIQSTQL